ncbi:MAG: hypothetical protein ACI3T9_03000 [Romboutsia timonensis]
MNKQRIDYRPQIGYISDYQTSGKSNITEQNIIFGPKNNTLPLDTNSIPIIQDNLDYIDSVIDMLPQTFSKALREVYDPIRDIFYEQLIDKIIDPNPQAPDIIFKPKDTTSEPENPDDSDNPNPSDPDNPEDPDDTDNPSNPDEPDNPDNPNNPENPDDSSNKKYIHPIILHPIDFNDLDNPDPPKDPDDTDKDKPIDPEDRNNVHPIILRPISSNDPGNNNDDKDPNDEIQAPHPIILHPIPGVDGEDPDGDSDKENPTPDPGDKDPDDPWDGEPGLWEEPKIKVEYLYPDIGEAVDREFVYLLSKLLKHYTNRLKDIMNNYFYSTIKNTLNQSEENINFITNKLELTSNDILNHSKHLLDSSVKSENTAALRTEFFKNTFSIRDTAIHLRSFLVSSELRKRYTNINYSKGKSMANSTSDTILKKLNAQYELKYRKDFENLFRYLESSLKVTNDILRLYIQDGVNKSTILKKGGIK